jgi:hypothetical protein
MKEFWEDKEREKTSIEDTKRLLEKEGYKFIKENNDNKYDLLFEKNGREVKIEVKQDFSCYRTGNVGVEYHCRGKNSGIFTSEADFYIYKLHQNTKYIRKTKKEKEQPNEIKTIVINKQRLKKIIIKILNDDVEDITYKEKYTKPNFEWKKIKIKDKEYKVQIRKINGGDIGSNSLNILFTRNSFIETFMVADLENRKRTEEETEDLNKTLENAKKRKEQRYGKEKKISEEKKETGFNNIRFKN